MTQEDDLEKIEELVNKGISLQREGKHQDAIIHFDEAIGIDQSLGGESDPNLLLLKNNSSMKLWLKTNIFAVGEFFKLNLTNVVKTLVVNATPIPQWIAQTLNFWKFMPNLVANQS